MDDRPGLTAEEVAGSVAARQALGPEAEAAVIQAFLERTGHAIDARVEERLAMRQPMMPQIPPMHQMQHMQQHPVGRRQTDYTPFVLGIISLGAGIPLTGIATQFPGNELVAVVVIWAAIALINLIYSRRKQ